MKKLLILVAAVGMACMAQANAFKWNFYVSNSASAGAADRLDYVGMTAYVVLGSTVADYSNVTVDDFKAGFSAGQYAEVVRASTSNTRTVWTGNQEYKSSSVVASGQTQNFYYVLVDESTGKFATFTGGSAVAYNPDASPAETPTTPAVFNDYTALDNATWTSFKSSGGTGGVPEPTSGLLLALGGAMLALRRKRA